MATIDLIVLGILKKEPMGAYDIQKLVEYRNISKWVKISTPSIYKKAIQLEEKGFIKGEIVKEGKMPEKAVYSLTDEGEKEFVKLMMETASKPIHFFLDFNAVIVNLDKLPPESQQSCIASIEENIEILKNHNIDLSVLNENVEILNDTELNEKLEKLISVGKESRDISLMPSVLVKYDLKGLNNTISVLQISGLDPKKVPLMAY